MLRLILPLVVIAMLVLCVQVFGQNLPTNPSFESLSSSLHLTSGTQLLTGWRYFSANGASFTLDSTSDTHDGAVAVRLTRNNTAGDAGLDRDDPSLRVIVGANKTYVFSAWMKASGSASAIMTISPYDSGGQYLGVQGSQTYTLTSAYQQYVFAYTTPANTFSVNLAFRVNGTGAILVDDCCLTPTAPRITYPVDEAVDRLKPTIGFTGLAHTGYQAQVLLGGNVAWDSGAATSTAYSAVCTATLQPSTSYQAKVRLMNTYGWGDYCAPVSFTTPPGPIIYFDSIKEADRVIGPDKLLTWLVESPGGPTSQSLVIDSQPAVQISNGSRSYQLSGLSDGVHSVTLTVISGEGTAQTSARFYVYSRPTTSGNLYFYDLSYVLNYASTDKLAYDIPLAVFALQGLVNRNGTRLLVKLSTYDDRWLSKLRASGEWLAGKTLVTLPTGSANLANLFNTFRSDYNGAVVWDPNIYATSNVATTVAGADNLIPIRYDTTTGSVYNLLVTNGPRLPVTLNLVNRFTGSGAIWGTNLPSTGSKKCDAYVWARNQYLETGKCDPSLLLYAIDGYWSVSGNKGALSNYLPIRDYIVRNKGFAYDLSVWGDEKPIDDPNQAVGTDLSTMRSILAAAAARTPGMIEEVGFCPFPMKYSNVSGAGGVIHDPVGCEWEQVKWASYYNAYVDADALAYYCDMENASLYCQYPFPDRLVQNRKFSPMDLRKLGYLDKNNVVSQLNYLNIYIGDYDSSSWLTRVGSDNWEDAGRGSVPMSWAFNPNLIKRAGPMYEYYNRTRTANDFFIAGDSGAGYVNPSRLLFSRESGLPPAGDIWIKHNLNYFRKTNVKISGFLIEGTADYVGPEVDDMYSEFSVDGVFNRGQDDHMSGTMPSLYQIRDLDMNDTATSSIDMVQPYGRKWATQFLNYRSVIRTPQWIQSLYTGVAARDTTIPWTIVDTETYDALAQCYIGSPRDCRATYTFDNVPSTVTSGVFGMYVVGVRNDGWSTWAASGSNQVTLLLKWMSGAQTLSSVSASLPRSVASGEAVTINVTAMPPSTPGAYTLHYEMARGGVAFTDLGDYAWEKTVTATASGHYTSVIGLTAVPTNGQVNLSWTNPADSNYAGVKVLFKTTGYPTGSSDGAQIYNGVGTTCSHTGLANGTVYYYSVFAYDRLSNYSDPTVASAMPEAFPDWIYETFDNYNTGNLGGQGAWLTVYGNTGQLQSVTAKDGTGNAVLYDPVAQGGSIGNQISLSDKASGYCYLSLDFYLGAGGSTGSEAAYLSLFGSDSPTEITTIHIQKGRLMVDFGASSTAVLATSLATQTWYNVRIGLNIDAKMLDFWLDGVSKGNNYAWKPGASRVSRVLIVSDRNTSMNPQKVYIDNVRVEPKPPTVAAVVDDGSYTPSLSKLHFSFDDIAGASGYEYCIGTSTSGAQIRGWTSLGVDTDFTASGLTLAQSTTYYVGIHSLNQYGTPGDRKNSNGIVVPSVLAKISDAKAHADASNVYAVRGKLVSAVFPGCFYIQEPGAPSGIRVVSNTAVAVSDQVDVAGFMAGSALERYIDCTGNGVIATSPGPGGPYPVSISSRNLGGGRANAYTPGIAGGVGVNNIGLLVRLFGRITGSDATSFTLDDGGVPVKCLLPSGASLDSASTYASVTGVSSCESVNGNMQRLLKVRNQADIVGF